MSVSVKHSGSFKHIEKFLAWAKREADFQRDLEALGQEGVEALAAATPKKTGLTANSWIYEIKRDAQGITVLWKNTNDQGGRFNVAVGLQYGHGTGTGGWVEGIDYINPAAKPVFDRIVETIWKKVESN